MNTAGVGSQLPATSGNVAAVRKPNADGDNEARETGRDADDNVSISSQAKSFVAGGQSFDECTGQLRSGKRE